MVFLVPHVVVFSMLIEIPVALKKSNSIPELFNVSHKLFGKSFEWILKTFESLLE